MSISSPVFESETYARRRELLCQKLPDCKILLLGNKNASVNFRDNHYHFRQDSTFLYYIGIDQPNLMAVIDTGKNETTLIGDDADIDSIVWTGAQESLHSLSAKVGISKVIPTSQAESIIDKHIHFLPPYRAKHTLQLSKLLKSTELQPSLPLIQAVIAQRNYKSAEEISLMEKAVTLSNEMHMHVMRQALPGQHEYNLVAEAKHFCASRNVQLAYAPIMTTRGHVLHNHDYSFDLQEGQMLLNDSGVEVPGSYCGDITRTFPVGPSFTSIQKEMYQVVYNAYLASVAMAKPGNSFLQVHLATAHSLVDGLKQLGIMKGDTKEAVAQGAHTMFFQCGVGHMIGMDVHDMENLGEQYVGYEHPHVKSTEFGLKSLRLARTLETGFCVTIEPGIYIIPELIDKMKAEQKHLDFIDYPTLEKHRNFGGIRLEDNFVITVNGNRNLDSSLPIKLEDIENLRSSVLQ